MASLTNPMIDVENNGQDEKAERETDDQAKNYDYRDWRDIMNTQQESLNSLISIGVINSGEKK